jgi:hypothetical protein
LKTAGLALMEAASFFCLLARKRYSGQQEIATENSKFQQIPTNSNAKRFSTPLELTDLKLETNKNLK